VKGVDPSAFATALMEQSSTALESGLNPGLALEEAYNEVKDRGIEGSCTCCILSFSSDQKNTLEAAVLGDSGLIHLRKGKILYRSPSQLTGFNKPFQLGIQSRHRPQDAILISIPVQVGDLVIAGTDGLFDNLFEEDIARCVSSCNTPEEAASLLGHLASRTAWSDEAVTPFSCAARASGRHYRGGKLDDITVVVSIMTSPS